jgi:hypothetical protein
MKTTILKTVFPLVAFVFAIAVAFAFKPAPDSADTNFFGAKKIGLHECQITSVECTDVNTGVVCQDGTATLYKMVSGTSCPNQLWRP